MALILIIIVGVVGYLGYRNSTVIQSVLGTLGWKSFTNTTYKLSFKYPSDYNFEQSNNEVGVAAWAGSISSPQRIINDDTKVWEVFSIGVAVRRKMGLSFDQWVSNECPKTKSKTSLQVEGRPAIEMICHLGSTSNNEEINWRIIAIDNGDYVYTLIDNAYQRDSELDKTFNHVVSTFRFIR